MVFNILDRCRLRDSIAHRWVYRADVCRHPACLCKSVSRDRPVGLVLERFMLIIQVLRDTTGSIHDVLARHPINSWRFVLR